MNYYKKQKPYYAFIELSRGHKLMMICAEQNVTFEKAAEILDGPKKPAVNKGGGLWIVFAVLFVCTISLTLI